MSKQTEGIYHLPEHSVLCVAINSILFSVIIVDLFFCAAFLILEKSFFRDCHHRLKLPITASSFWSQTLQVLVRKGLNFTLDKSCDTHVISHRRGRGICCNISGPFLHLSKTVLSGAQTGGGGAGHAHRMCHFPTGIRGPCLSSEIDSDHHSTGNTNYRHMGYKPARHCLDE